MKEIDTDYLGLVIIYIHFKSETLHKKTLCMEQGEHFGPHIKHADSAIESGLKVV